MAAVVRWASHKLHGAWDCRTPASDPDFECIICTGGLSLCTVCGGAEGAMPTDCPGRWMTSQEVDDVFAGKLDYRQARGWVAESNYIRLHKEKPDDGAA